MGEVFGWLTPPSLATGIPEHALGNPGYCACSVLHSAESATPSVCFDSSLTFGEPIGFIEFIDLIGLIDLIDLTSRFDRSLPSTAGLPSATLDRAVPPYSQSLLRGITEYYLLFSSIPGRPTEQ